MIDWQALLRDMPADRVGFIIEYVAALATSLFCSATFGYMFAIVVFSIGFEDPLSTKVLYDLVSIAAMTFIGSFVTGAFALWLILTIFFPRLRPTLYP